MPESVETCKKNGKWMDRLIKFEFVNKGYHFGAVTGLDICIQRPLFVTYSKYDNSIRVWNYHNFKCE